MIPPTVSPVTTSNPIARTMSLTAFAWAPLPMAMAIPFSIVSAAPPAQAKALAPFAVDVE